MTDKIKLKANKFVNDKKLKLNYIKPKDLKLLLTEFCEEQIAELKAECDLAIEGRDVKIAELEHQLTHRNCVDCSNHSSKLKMKVLELEKENAELRNNGFTVSAMTEQQLKVALKKGEQLEKENVELRAFKEKCKFNIIDICKEIKRENNLAKAKELLKKFIETSNPIYFEEDRQKVKAEAEQFLSEVEKC